MSLHERNGFCFFLYLTFISITTKNYFTMPQLINYGNEMLRISPKGIEYSTTNGRSWNTRYSGSTYGAFIDLLPYGNELLAVTTKGVYYSTTGGHSWNSRYTGSVYGTFNSLVDNGRELLANTSKGLYYSTTNGRSWNRRREYIDDELLTTRIILRESIH